MLPVAVYLHHFPAMPELPSTIAWATEAYYAQAAAVPLTATDFYDWLGSLSAGHRAQVMRQGLGEMPRARMMLRYCLEKRGHSMWRFMAGQLSAADFARWADHV